MSFWIFGGFFLYTEHAPWWVTVAFSVACGWELAQAEREKRRER